MQNQLFDYETLWSSEFDSSVCWNSRTIRSNSSIKGNRAINGPMYYNGDIKHHGNLEERTIHKVNTREEGVAYFNTELQDKLQKSSGFSGRGPTAKSIFNENEFYFFKYGRILEFGQVKVLTV